MRPLGWLTASSVILAMALLSRPAAADSMDPALARFVADGACRAAGPSGSGAYYNPSGGFTGCTTKDALFAKLVAQYGFAIAPTAMHSARTTGYGGFELALEASYTKIDSDATYWKLGTEGPQDPTTKNFSVVNNSPDSLLQLYSLKIRKGFPLGIELAGIVGFLPNTNIVTGGADVRWSLLEGFRTEIPAIFPELAVGGGVRTITGTEEMQLTVAAVDAQISKPLPIGGAVVLTPYVGYQWLRIFGDSGLIDMTPNTDALNYCGFAGANTPASPDPTKTYADGQPVCNAGSSADFNNTAVLDAVRLSRHRLNAGLQVRYQVVKVGMHFITDLVAPEDANKGSDYESPDPSDPTTDVNDFEGVTKQWTLAFDIGAVF